MFGFTDLYGGYSGGQAEYVRVPKPHWNVPEETVRLILPATTEVKTLSK